ncbi:MAG: AMP-binding protein [Betaproteobacteria bacterium]
MRLPLAGYHTGSDALLLGPEGEISAGAFFTRARELAGLLPDAPFIINLAESRVGFMLGFAASLVRGTTSLLPSGQGRGDWEQLMHEYPGAAIISDRPIDAPDTFDLKPYLTMGNQTLPGEDSGMSIPDIPADFRAALLFTSGSTGRPTSHAKSWGQLTRGAALLSAALGWTRPVPYAVVGSVPPQHMFGLESTVMLPWQAGIPVHAHKPLLPADIESALAQCARPCWWMTTPLHLRPPLQAAAAMRGLAGVVASTMSLPPALAAAAEATWQVPVVEVYGSTETGALATRRTAAEEWWTPLSDVTLTPQTDGDIQRIVASGSHIDVPVMLGDELRINVDGRFLWLGRCADMLKIGGKRASLSALNLRINEIPGVDDAVYFVPDAAGDAAFHDDSHPARRLAAFYVSTQLSPGQVQAALRARVDPVFVPRPLFRVAHLPRNENGKLPQAVLAELFLHLREANSVAAPTDNPADPPEAVSKDHPALPGHFPGNPIVPGVVVLSRMAEAIRRRLPQVVPGTLLTARFYVPLRPGQPFTVSAELRGERVFVEIREDVGNGVCGKLIAAGQWACATGERADLRMGRA